MKTYSNYSQMTKERFDAWTRRYSTVTPSYENHPREDYHLISNKYPIYIVADGVTLKRDAEGIYPTPSGAYELAKIFCHTIVEEAEKMYESFTEQKLNELFKLGNAVTDTFNKSLGRTKDVIDYREFDMFAVTTAFVLIKDETVYWWSLGDSGITAFDENKNNVFQSPEAWPDEKEKIQATGNQPLSDTEFNKLKKKLFRNVLNEKGERFGYGVVTGEDTASVYLNTGSFSIKTGYLILVYTDGYEYYIPLSDFIEVFNNEEEDIDIKFKNYIEQKAKDDSDLYGREKTIIAIKV